MSWKDQKPKQLERDYDERTYTFYDGVDMDDYLAVVEPMAEKLEAIKTFCEKEYVRSSSFHRFKFAEIVLEFLEGKRESLEAF